MDAGFATLLGALLLILAAWCFGEMVVDIEARDRARDHTRPGPNGRRK